VTGYEVPKCTCPHCKADLDRAGLSAVDDDGEGPAPGDFSVCVYCARPLAFAEDMTLRPCTEDGVSEVLGHLGMRAAMQMAEMRKKAMH
jgi:hypothetical protein